MINYIFEIDVKGEKTKYSDIVLTSGDRGAARFSFSFKDGKEPFETEGLMLLIKAKRADGIIITDAGFFYGGKFHIDLKNSMTSVSGELSFEIALTDEEGMLVTVSEIICTVREGYGEADLKATDTTPILANLSSRALKAENSAAEAELSAEEAKSAALKAEEALKKAESITIDDILSETSENPVQNKVVTAELLKKATIREVKSTDSSLEWHVEDGEANIGDIFSDTVSYCNFSGGHAEGDIMMVVPINGLMPKVAYICTHGSYHPTTGYSYSYEKIVTPDYVSDAVTPVQEKAEQALAKAEKAENYKYITKYITETQLFSVVPNAVTYICGTLENSEVQEIAFALVDAEITTENLTEEYVLILDFTNMTSIPTITFGNDIKWINGEPPAIETGKVYMFSFTNVKDADNNVLFSLGVGGEFA